MKIHHSKIDTTGRTIVISESAAPFGGRKYGHFQVLRVVMLPISMKAQDYRTVAQKGVSVLFEAEADGRSRGARSGFNRAMAAAEAVFAKA